MKHNINRRNFLRTAAVSAAPFSLRDDQNNVNSGEIVDVAGRQVSADVVVYDATGTAQLPVLETQTDAEGKFRLDQSSLPDEYTLAITQRDGDFFGTIDSSSFAADSTSRITLLNEFITPPLMAMNEAATKGKRQGMLTLWRQFNRDDPRTQTLFAELTEVPFGWGDNEWVIDSAVGRADPNAARYSSYASNNPIETGAISVVVPEDGVHVDYDGQSLSGTPPLGVWYAPDRFMSGQPRRLQRFHPTLTGLPAFTLANSNFLGLTDAIQERDQAIEGGALVLTGAAIGAVSQGAGLLLQLGGFLSDLLEIDLGPDSPAPIKLSESEPRVDPDQNEQDIVSTLWTTTASSIVFAVPVRLEGESAKRIQFELEWVPMTLGNQLWYANSIDLDVPSSARTWHSRRGNSGVSPAGPEGLLAAATSIEISSSEWVTNQYGNRVWDSGGSIAFSTSSHQIRMTAVETGERIFMEYDGPDQTFRVKSLTPFPYEKTGAIEQPQVLTTTENSGNQWRDVSVSGDTGMFQKSVFQSYSCAVLEDSEVVVTAPAVLLGVGYRFESRITDAEFAVTRDESVDPSWLVEFRLHRVDTPINREDAIIVEDVSNSPSQDWFSVSRENWDLGPGEYTGGFWIFEDEQSKSQGLNELIWLSPVENIEK